MKKKVSFHTLGCKLNFSESSTLARRFTEGGYERVAAGQQSDIIVVNTCSVTDHADKKCRNLIRRLHKNNPSALVVVTGCYAQLKAEEIAAIDGVDLVVGNNGKGSLFELADRLAARRGHRDTHMRRLGADVVFRLFLHRRPHPFVSESTGRLRLQVLLLHHTVGTRLLTQYSRSRSGTRSRDHRRLRLPRDSAHRRQYRRFRAYYRGEFRRSAPRARRCEGHRAVSHFVHRA